MYLSVFVFSCIIFKVQFFSDGSHDFTTHILYFNVRYYLKKNNVLYFLCFSLQFKLIMRLDQALKWSQKSNLVYSLTIYDYRLLVGAFQTLLHNRTYMIQSDVPAVTEHLPPYVLHQAGEERLHHSQIHREAFRQEEVSWCDVAAPHPVWRSEGARHFLPHPGLRRGSRPHGTHTSGQRTRQYTKYFSCVMWNFIPVGFHFLVILIFIALYSLLMTL